MDISCKTFTDKILFNSRIILQSFFPDSVIFAKPRKAQLNIKIDPVLIGYLKDELKPESLHSIYILGAKNYSIVKMDNTGKVTGVEVKVRGLNLAGNSTIDSGLMSKFLSDLKKRQKAEVVIPQFQMKIDSKSYEIYSNPCSKRYTNECVESKSFFNMEKSNFRLWPYGITSYKSDFETGYNLK